MKLHCIKALLSTGLTILYSHVSPLLHFTGAGTMLRVIYLIEYWCYTGCVQFIQNWTDVMLVIFTEFQSFLMLCWWLSLFPQSALIYVGGFHFIPKLTDVMYVVCTTTQRLLKLPRWCALHPKVPWCYVRRCALHNKIPWSYFRILCGADGQFMGCPLVSTITRALVQNRHNNVETFLI